MNEYKLGDCEKFPFKQVINISNRKLLFKYALFTE